MRLKSELWVQGYIQKLSAVMISAFVIKRGHESAGAIYLKINQLNGFCSLYSPAPSAFDESTQAGQDDRRWLNYFEDKPLTEAEADQWLAEQKSFDADIWIIEVEDKTGAPHLDKHSLTGL